MAQSSSAHTTDSHADHPFDIDDDAELRFEDVDGGTLVYRVRQEYRAHMDRTVDTDRKLVGFKAVSDWDGIRSALSKRGHDIGAQYHLPVMD